MAREITLNAVSIVSEATLQSVLDDFEAQHHTHVNLQYVGWDEYRQEFTNIALHRLAGDVAIAGTPATSDLIAMNALRPFSTTEITMLGGEKAFLPSRWKAGIRPGDPNQWAIPIVVDPRVIYYRRDLLAKAGVAEEGAFTTAGDIVRTVQRLHEGGVEVPWLAGVDRFAVLHRVASIIWAHGGGIFAPDGRRVTFHEDEALEAIRLYFQMVHRYRAVPESAEAMRKMLLDGKVGVIIENAFLLFTPAPPEIGCAPMPGGSYIGGSDLIIWNHTRSEYASLELVRFLTQPGVAARLLPESFYLPARMDYLNELANRPDDPIAATIGKAVLNGRTFPCVPMIGLIEDRLATALYSIQQELLSNPQVDLEKLFQQRIVALGKRTNISLGGLHP